MSGVYIIQNIINSKCYTGSSLNTHRRLGSHRCLLLKNKHHSYKLQGAINKYGINNFEFKVIEDVYFPEIYDKETKIEYLECREDYYIKKYNSYKRGYNVSEIPRIVGNHTKESIQKGIATRRRKGSYNINTLNAKQRGLAVKNSLAFKEGHKRGRLKRLKIIYQYDLDGNFIREWKSIDEASNELKIYKSIIRKNIRGQYYRCKKYIFSYDKKDKAPSYRELKTTLGRRSTHMIYMYNRDGELIDTFSDVIDCATKLQKKRDTIYGYLTRPSKDLEYKFIYGQRTK